MFLPEDPLARDEADADALPRVPALELLPLVEVLVPVPLLLGGREGGAIVGFRGGGGGWRNGLNSSSTSVSSRLAVAMAR